MTLIKWLQDPQTKKTLRNPGTWIGLTSAALFIATNLGIQVDNTAITNVMKGLLSVGIILGVLNNPQTPGLDIPFIKKDVK